MTLQQAHALQRRELMSLRAENTRLKKQMAQKDSERPELKELAALRAENERLKTYSFPDSALRNNRDTPGSQL